MKKVLGILFAVIVIAALGVGGFLYYETTTPEYMLAKTIEDVQESGIDGLRPHLTADACEKLDTVVEWTEKPIVGGILSLFSGGDDGYSFLKSKLEEIDWTVEDLMKGKTNAEVIIGFNYQDEVTGTVGIELVREDDGWKISNVELPSFDS